ncbi:uncharacterized protein LOC104662514 [Rhinopithecus roxellana]|uniref:uncharacterized protein LOC104662514 n=1 Tax=Rhinopithecus roxellana TaxID=61622 RepID=UPI0005333DF1|nr:uncharacterized protein LOC104662514 [Rhinopithecus roxellana]
MTIMFYLCFRFEFRVSPSQSNQRARQASRWGEDEGRGRPAAAANRPAAEARREDQHSLTQNGGAKAEAGAPGGATRPTGFPQTAASWTRAPGPGGPHRSAPGPARRGHSQPVARVAAWCPRDDAGGGEGLARPPRPHPQSAPEIGSALTSDAPREPLEGHGKGGGAARMNGAGGCSLATSGWSRAAPLAAARAGAAASRSPQTPGSSSRVGRGPPCPPTT